MEIITQKIKQSGSFFRGEPVGMMIIARQHKYAMNSPTGSIISKDDSDLDPRPSSTDPTEPAAAEEAAETAVAADSPQITPTVSVSSYTSESSESGSSLRRLTKPIGKLLCKLPSIDGEDETPGTSALERKDSKPFIGKLLSTKKTGQDANDPDRLQSGSNQKTEEKSCLIIRMVPNTKLSRFADAHLSHRSPIASQHSLPSSSSDQAVQEEPEVTEKSTSQTSAEDKVTDQSKDSPLLGYWKSEANENWDTFLKEAGLGVLLRRISCEMTTFEDISTTGDQWHIRMLSSLKNFEHCFRLDEEFEEENFDGYRVKAIAWLEEYGRKLTMQQTALDSEGLELHIVRELMSDDRLLLTVTSQKSGITAKRHFVRIPQDQMP